MHDPHSMTYEQAHRRYRALRRLACEETVRAAAEAGLRRAVLTEIDAAALSAWRGTWAHRRHWTGEGGFPWNLLTSRYRRKPRCFHVAIWGGGARRIPDIHCAARSRSSRSQPRKRMRGPWAKALVLKNPLRGVVEWYVQRGFQLVRARQGNVYYYKQLT
jgi:hypothetical protein